MTFLVENYGSVANALLLLFVKRLNFPPNYGFRIASLYGLALTSVQLLNDILWLIARLIKPGFLPAGHIRTLEILNTITHLITLIVYFADHMRKYWTNLTRVEFMLLYLVFIGVLQGWI
jgi:hypothetical protein